MRERLEWRFRRRRLAGRCPHDGRRDRRVGVDHAGRAVDHRRAADAALIAERERRRRRRIRRSRGRREDQGVERAGDRGRGSRQRIDAADPAAQSRSAQRPAGAAEGDRQRVGRADVGVAYRHRGERLDWRFRCRRLAGRCPHDGRRDRRVGVDHAGRAVDHRRAAGAALIAERERRRRRRIGRSRGRRED